MKTHTHKTSLVLGFIKDLSSFFVLYPVEVTAHESVKKYFSSAKVSDEQELYSDWKCIGDDFRFVLSKEQGRVSVNE